MVAADDVARAAAAVLTTDRHGGRNYELTGPEALTYAEIAERLSRALGRPVAYTDLPEADYRQMMIDQAGIPEDQVDMAVMYHFHAFREGWADLVTDTVES